MSQFTSQPDHKTVYNPDGAAVDVPLDTIENWQYDVANLNTTQGLLDYHQDQTEGEDSNDAEPADLHERVLAVLKPLTGRREPISFAKHTLNRANIEMPGRPRRELVGIIDGIVSETHSNEDIADAIVEYLGRC